MQTNLMTDYKHDFQDHVALIESFLFSLDQTKRSNGAPVHCLHRRQSQVCTLCRLKEDQKLKLDAIEIKSRNLEKPFLIHTDSFPPTPAIPIVSTGWTDWTSHCATTSSLQCWCCPTSWIGLGCERKLVSLDMQQLKPIPQRRPPLVQTHDTTHGLVSRTLFFKQNLRSNRSMFVVHEGLRWYQTFLLGSAPKYPYCSCSSSSRKPHTAALIALETDHHSCPQTSATCQIMHKFFKTDTEIISANGSQSQSYSPYHTFIKYTFLTP